MTKAQEILEQLRLQSPSRLEDLPSLSGIYALFDHEGCMRYIGIAHTEGFRTRIRNKHSTGSEDRSHKFSCAYNTGRLWRDRHSDPKDDAKVAKRLRNALILRHCRATYVAIEGYETKRALEAIEQDVLALAEPDERVWNSSFVPGPEPVALVDSLISELRYGQAETEALARQNARYLEAAN